MDPSTFPAHVLSLHSSKKVLVEQLTSSTYLLADAIISLTLEKGNKTGHNSLNTLILRMAKK